MNNFEGKPLLECPMCGWCHYGVDEDYVGKWKQDWAEYFKTMSKEDKECFGLIDKPPSDDTYRHCFGCGNRDLHEFFESTKDLTGHTIGPILDKRSSK